MYTSHKPPMMAVSVGVRRYSLQVIRAAKAFVIAFPAALMAEEALFYGTKSGREVNKFKARPLQPVPASRIDCVLLSDAAASRVNEDETVRRLYSIEPGHVMGSVDVRRSG